ncbi:MAG TPA: hypothetical protein VKR59_15925 [Terriglobales bacterium]|nr:hypothetical protein [Terriglobales bacterium]
MSDIIAAADQTAATTLLHDAEATLGRLSKSGGGSLGPFVANYSASVSFSGGSVDLIPPNIIQLADCNVNYSLNFSFGIDLNDFLPSFCLPQICIFGWCTPKICISWPTVTIPISFSDTLTITGDFTVSAAQVGPNWIVSITIQSVPLLQFGAGTAALLAVIAAAVTAAVVWIPFIGPFLAGLADLVIAAIGIAGLTGLLGDIITPFISGLTFTLPPLPAKMLVLPAGGPTDPEVDVTITALGAAVQASDKNELVLSASIA